MEALYFTKIWKLPIPKYQYIFMSFPKYMSKLKKSLTQVLTQF